MKQKSNILFHFLRPFLRNRYSRAICAVAVAFLLLVPITSAVEKPEYLASHDSAQDSSLLNGI
ncbi:MAG: hypothetical protein P4L99_15680 [Chthoniobacter sp.]|nr:hypothetical protein [Chthoniobacter sp.]